MRINKYLASAGIASRRKCEELIFNGDIKVNGKVVKELATEIADNDIVFYKNKPVVLNEEKVYYIFNKPKGCVTTSSDDRGRKTVLDYFEDITERLFCVGRLDYNTQGLLILTNDGDFANEIMHPSKHIAKTYLVEIKGKLNDEEIKKLQNGVEIDGKKTLPSLVKIVEEKENKSFIEITIYEGRNRQVRKMFEAVNKLVINLERIKIGNLTLNSIPRGSYKKVSYQIIKQCLKEN